MGEPKYLLMSYDRRAESEGEQGYEETRALCEEAADLFADPPPPVRDMYVRVRIRTATAGAS
ncbi:hypothetical protein [Streptomyces cellulosae]|uniref:hypothetical protein n=1 Tax=Streptomyces cellulosae TaxID=1968 RepID=UPI0004C5E853|nr:hypothetical protein [Streptomyces cellulosae]